MKINSQQILHEYFLLKIPRQSFEALLNKTLVIKNKYCTIFLNQSVSKSIVSKYLDKTLAIKICNALSHVQIFSVNLSANSDSSHTIANLIDTFVSHTCYNTGINSLFPPHCAVFIPPAYIHGNMDTWNDCYDQLH